MVIEENEEMLTLAEAEKRYGITREGIYYHARKGNLSTYRRLGDKKAYVKVSELAELASFHPSAGRHRKTAQNQLTGSD